MFYLPSFVFRMGFLAVFKKLDIGSIRIIMNENYTGYGKNKF